MERFQDPAIPQEAEPTPSKEAGPPTQVFLKPMETFHSEPGGEDIPLRINKYFDEVMGILNYNERARQVYLNIDYKTPYFEGRADKKLYPTDDTIISLTAHDKLVAFVYETRTMFNYIDIAMVCVLTSKLLSQLQEQKELLNKD